MTRRIVIWTLAGLVVAAGLVTTILHSSDDLPWMTGPAVALLLGVLIEPRSPCNVVGRLMMAFGALTLLSGGSIIWLEDASADIAAWSDAIANGINTAGVLLLPLIMLRFPDGWPASSRWRVAEMGQIPRPGPCIGASRGGRSGRSGTFDR